MSDNTPEQDEEGSSFAEEISAHRNRIKEQLNMSVDKLAECREIVAKINEFGVTQKQLLQIISLLALEVENFQVSTELAVLVKTHLASLPKEDWEIQQEIIVPA